MRGEDLNACRCSFLAPPRPRGCGCSGRGAPCPSIERARGAVSSCVDVAALRPAR